ncbi:MAG: ABC transporter ATP-binding protein [Promethearchaeota archaeon]
MSSEPKDYRNYKSYGGWLLKHLSKQKTLVLGNLMGITIVTLSRTLVAVAIGNIIDNALSTDAANLIKWLVIALALYLISHIMDYITMMIGHYLGLKVERNMRQEFFDSIQKKPLRYHDNIRTGNLLAFATNDVRIINTALSHGSFYIYPFFQFGIAAVLLFNTLDLRLGLISLPFFALYFYFVLDYRKRISPYISEQLKKHSNLAIVLQDSLTGADVVKSFTAEEFERKKFTKAVNDVRDNWININWVQAKFYPLLVVYIMIGTLFAASGIFVYLDITNGVINPLTVGELAAINLLLITLIQPTEMVFWATKDMMSGFAAVKRLFNALKRDGEESYERSMKWPENFKGWIEFKNVTFAYDHEYENEGKDSQPPVLKNLSFTIEPNQRVALVGPTGCGKTTIAKLLLHFYQPKHGNILFDGKDISDYPLKTLRTHVGYIEQDVYLFPRSIRENISFGALNATEEAIINAAKLAQVDDFVQKLPNKYNTMVGERGIFLSGGEKQRIAIARAFLTDPEILILDDSVSAVDSETEEKIGRAMENIIKNRTTIVITHRLHTIRNATKILLLKHGKIAAEGIHDVLIQSSADYRRIFGKHMALPKINNKEINEGSMQ